jgi:hypothetical protein
MSAVACRAERGHCTSLLAATFRLGHSDRRLGSMIRKACSIVDRQLPGYLWTADHFVAAGHDGITQMG